MTSDTCELTRGFRHSRSHRCREHRAHSPTEPCSDTQTYSQDTQAHHPVYPSRLTCTRMCTQTALAGSTQQLRSHTLEGALGKVSLAQAEGKEMVLGPDIHQGLERH